MAPRAALLACLAVLLLAGCATRVAERDGPPPDGAARDAAPELPEVVPQNEPLSPYGNPDRYEVFGETYYVKDAAEGYVEEGIASWYGTKFHGQRTSSGEPYNMFAMTAAHTSLPLPTYVRVTNLDNERSVIVKVNDRGPFVDNRIIDLSYSAAKRIDMHERGTAPVRVEALPGGTPIADGATTTAAADGEEAGGDSVVVDKAPEPDVTVESTNAGGAEEAYIQLGAFRAFANAQQVRAEAAGADVRNVKVSRARTAEGKRIYRVRIGPLSNAADRDQVIERLEAAGIDPGRVVFD